MDHNRPRHEQAAAPEWVRALSALAHGAPALPRQPLWAGQVLIGSVAPGLLQRLKALGVTPADLCWQPAGAGWQLPPEPTQALLKLGPILRANGLVPLQREEWLDIIGDNNACVGAVQRDLARLLGLTTHSVHLVGLTAQGHCWVQQRALSKVEDPGLWDTLVGATLGRGETPHAALERELWEEAGLLPAQVSPWIPCGQLRVTQARGTDGLAFQVEHIHGFVTWLPDGLAPHNQDGEVSSFACLTPQQLTERLQARAFTVESTSVLLQSKVLSGLAVPEGNRAVTGFSDN